MKIDPPPATEPDREYHSPWDQPGFRREWESDTNGYTRHYQVYGWGDSTIWIGHEGFDERYLYAGSGNDTVHGTQGREHVYGQGGNDRLYGYGGSDILEGGAGDDIVVGGSGDDHLVGQDGFDILQGDAGHDILIGGAGNDALTGGGGPDSFWFETAEEAPGRMGTIWDFVSGEDTIAVNGHLGIAPDRYIELQWDGATFDEMQATALLNLGGNTGNYALFIGNGTDGYLFVAFPGDAVADQHVVFKGLGSVSQFDHTDIALQI